MFVPEPGPAAAPRPKQWRRIEAEDRARRSLERRLGRGKLGKFKADGGFDWAWPKHIDRDAVESAVALDFMGKAHNVVLVAPQGRREDDDSVPVNTPVLGGLLRRRSTRCV
jgi:hypothetical protein